MLGCARCSALDGGAGPGPGPGPGPGTNRKHLTSTSRSRKGVNFLVRCDLSLARPQPGRPPYLLRRAVFHEHLVNVDCRRLPRRGLDADARGAPLLPLIAGVAGRHGVACARKARKQSKAVGSERHHHETELEVDARERTKRTSLALAAAPGAKLLKVRPVSALLSYTVPIRNSEPPGPTEALVPQLKLRRRGSKLEDGARGARGVLVEQQQVGLREPGQGRAKGA